jgi:hypothetical protein
LIFVHKPIREHGKKMPAPDVRPVADILTASPVAGQRPLAANRHLSGMLHCTKTLTDRIDLLIKAACCSAAWLGGALGDDGLTAKHLEPSS